MVTASLEPSTFALVKSVLEDVGTELGFEELRSVDPDTPVFGGAEGIDSLSLVHVVAAVERAAQQHYGRPVVLADERAMSRRHSPFRTAGTLAALLHERLHE